MKTIAEHARRFLECQAIAVIIASTPQAIEESGITAQHFTNEQTRQAFEFIAGFVEKYGELPTFETLAHNMRAGFEVEICEARRFLESTATVIRRLKEIEQAA